MKQKKCICKDSLEEIKTVDKLGFPIASHAMNCPMFKSQRSYFDMTDKESMKAQQDLVSAKLRGPKDLRVISMSPSKQTLSTKKNLVSSVVSTNDTWEEELKTELLKILFKHRANDRGNSDLNLFDDKENLQEQDKYYADLILEQIKKSEAK
jgi:hypothetical protein